jgi:DNA polymerase I-like protein with 3'-5' exonuclease and polymerase domains
MRGDENGLWWTEQPRVRANAPSGPRPLPPIPETAWRLPEGLEAYPSLEGQGWIAIDVETHDPQLRERGMGAWRDGKLVGAAVGTQAGFRQYYPIAHEIGPNLPKEYVISWLRREMKRPVPKVGANLLYDLSYLAAYDVEVVGPFYDIQIAEPLLDETQLSYSLENISQRRLGVGKVETEMSKWLAKAFGDEAHVKSNIWRAPSAVVGPYAEGDVDLPLRIFEKQKAELEEQGLWELFVLESKLIPMLVAMHRRGVPVDLARANELYDDMSQRQTDVLAKIKTASGIDVDLWAAASLAKVFDKLDIPYPRTDKTNAPSFRKEWLAQQEHPIARLIRDARGYDKLKETFVKGFVIEGHHNGKIHCQFNQLRSDEGGTVSGRMSSSKPNLQQIPIRDKIYGKQIRSLFIAEPDNIWWKFDWSQIEYRLIVHYAALLKLPGAADVVEKYHTDPSTDYHVAIAKMTGLPRDQAKNLNFGLAYGQGLWLLCHNLGVDQAEGARIIDEYHTKAPYIRALSQTATRQANSNGVIRTMGGRLRRFNIWEKTDANTGKIHYSRERISGYRRAFTHAALNALIQGSAADIMKTAMVQIWESGICGELGAPHLTVHDELDGSSPPTRAGQEALAEVKRIMEGCVSLLVPLRADGGVGPDWGRVEDDQMVLI